MDDIRWFAPNLYTTLLAHELRRRGFAVALEGSAPAGLALSMSGTTALSAWHYARRVGCPLVLYIWDLPPRATGSGSYDPIWAVGSHLIRVPRIAGGFAHRRGYYSRLRYLATRAQEVWVPSQVTADLLRTRFGMDSRRVPYCYDSDRFTPVYAPKDHPPTLLTVGRLKPHKNHAATLRAASRLSLSVQVRLIGRGSEAAALERAARSLGVSYRIETLADDRTVVDAYQRASVAVCPSRFEGFGLAPLEAIACGTPVVASDIPAHREFVGTLADMFPLDDEEALVAAVRRALDASAPDPEAIRDLSIPATAERFIAGLRPLLQG
jgi:glycosyltransferase involved in cell wall biosynthesis